MKNIYSVKIILVVIIGLCATTLCFAGTYEETYVTTSRNQASAANAAMAEEYARAQARAQAMAYLEEYNRQQSYLAYKRAQDASRAALQAADEKKAAEAAKIEARRKCEAPIILEFELCRLDALDTKKQDYMETFGFAWIPVIGSSVSDHASKAIEAKAGAALQRCGLSRSYTTQLKCAN